MLHKLSIRIINVRIGGYLLLFVLWLSSFYASVIMAYAEFISLWYMPSGIALGGFLILGKRAFIPIFLGIFYVSLHFDKLWGVNFDPTHLAAASLFALAHTVSYGLGGLASRYWLQYYVNYTLATRILGLLVIYASAALLAAISGLLVWQFTTETNDHILASGWFAWWLGDLIGVMVIVPLVCFILSRFIPEPLPWLRDFYEHNQLFAKQLKPYLTKLTVAIVTVLGILLLDSYIDNPGMAYFIFFVTIPQLWIVLTERTINGVISLFIITAVLSSGVHLFDVADQAMTYQFALYITSAISYFAISVPMLIHRTNQLQSLAMKDLLTQLPTQWLFTTVVTQVVKSSLPNQTHSLAVFNIDHFKTINVDYGQSVGDQVLRQSAQLLLQELRDSEVICRVSGDTFMLFMPNRDLTQAESRANQIRLSFPILNFDDLVLPIRASFGVTQVQFGEPIEETIERAQQALKQAKQVGRNRVIAVN